MAKKALISCMVTAQLISAFVFADSKSRFSHNLANIVFQACVYDRAGIGFSERPYKVSVVHRIDSYPIRIHHDLLDRIDNSVMRVTVCRHKAPAVIGGTEYLSFPQTHVGFFFLHAFGCQSLNKRIITTVITFIEIRKSDWSRMVI